MSDGGLATTSARTRARRAGALYLLLAVLAPFNLIWIPGNFIVAGDPAATAANIAAGELTFRVGIYAGLASSVVFLLLGLILYDLLRDVDRRQARVMLALVTVSVAVGIANLLNQVAPLILLSGADFLSAFTEPQLEAFSLGFLRLHGTVTHLEMAFWGLWLVPFGVLVIRSGFIPRFLGFLLIAGCFAYLALSFTTVVFPAHRGAVDRVSMPVYAVAEGSMILWLLVWGARSPESGEEPTDQG